MAKFYTTVPKIVKRIYPQAWFNFNEPNQRVYLTFDDGPTPGVTEAALDLLALHGAKATFFCLGKNVVNHPEIYQRILQEGHSVGNHTMHHELGWKTGVQDYLNSIDECGKLVDSKLFRPPYGKIRPRQVRAVQEKYRMVMWEVLTGDFLENRSVELCTHAFLNYTRPGSIVVFHDSHKAAERMLPTLEKGLAHFTALGFEFAALPMDGQLPSKQ